MFYNMLVRGIILYGLEVQGWEKQEEIEKLQLNNLKWKLRLKINTQTYIVLEEI